MSNQVVRCPKREVAIGRPGRHLAIYHARAGYDLQEELDFLTNRALEPNIFFLRSFSRSGHATA
jgi:hypothetical protein